MQPLEKDKACSTPGASGRDLQVVRSAISVVLFAFPGLLLMPGLGIHPLIAVVAGSAIGGLLGYRSWTALFSFAGALFGLSIGLGSTESPLSLLLSFSIGGVGTYLSCFAIHQVFGLDHSDTKERVL